MMSAILSYGIITNFHFSLNIVVLYIGCLKKTAHAIILLLMTQMKKLYRKRNGSKNTTNLSEHIIFIPSTHLWAMVNFYFLNGNL
jgi:hypothetical protein